MDDDVEPLRFRVTDAFIITGRGLVAAGVAESGRLPYKGDQLVVQHDGTRREVTCEGVEWIRVIPPADPATVGLWLAELTTDDVSAGDLITAGTVSQNNDPSPV